jgi:hypothetical protein
MERTIEDALVMDGAGHIGRVPGGYAEWEATWRTPPPRTGPPQDRPAVVRRTSSDESTPKRRSPSTLHRLMREAEKAIAAAQRTRDRLVTELEAAGTDHAQLARIGTALAEAEADVLAREEEWLALAEEAES